MKISIIIPVLNEADSIRACLEQVQSWRRNGHEVIVVDGGSSDDTLALTGSLASRCLSVEPPGRARQMNAGAAIASGDVLVFLHADTLLPAEAETVLLRYAREGYSWGRFDVTLSGGHWLLRIVEATMNNRSRVTGVATGDQAIFVSRSLFERVGGYPDIPLMEDIALSKILKRLRTPYCLRQRVVTSSRRWEKRGIVRTVLLMWWLRLRYFLGAEPGKLASQYER